MKNNYEKITPLVLALSMGLQSLTGCVSTQRISEDIIKRKLKVQRLEDINNYPGGYKASWRSKGAIRQALGDYAQKYKTHSETMSNALKDMDVNGDKLITDYEAENFGK